MAISAVPGSGKTFTLSMLAAQLIVDGKVDIASGQQLLIVTYLNASVDNFKTKLREKLISQGVKNPAGFDVRTQHSLSLEIVRLMHSDQALMPLVIDDSQVSYLLRMAIDSWQVTNPSEWQAYLPREIDAPKVRAKWREAVERMAKAFIRVAKNEQYRPSDILAAFAQTPHPDQFQFIPLLSGIYETYQLLLLRKGALDYNDQIWQAVQYVENEPELVELLRRRWPYILEDEAQDSVPLQQQLIEKLVGEDGNWVRVGDPNQAITSTFTAARPDLFRAFCHRSDVTSLILNHAGRNAPKIFRLANYLLHWVTTQHPVPEVRSAFEVQWIRPTPEGDGQPNPSDDDAFIVIKQYNDHEQEEVPKVVELARRYMAKYPDRTVAILVPTNVMGETVSLRLDREKINYDSLLRSGSRERQIAAVLHTLMVLFTEPLKPTHYVEVFFALREIEHPMANEPLTDVDRFRAILMSLYKPESFLYPQTGYEMKDTLPRMGISSIEMVQLEKFSGFLRHLFQLRPLPIDAMVLALADELFAHSEESVREGDLAVAYQIANLLRVWQDIEPERRLPDLTAELWELAQGRRELSKPSEQDAGFEPRPGYVTLATQHKSKGLEWDAVFLLGIDRNWIPDSLDDYFQGVTNWMEGDPVAVAVQELQMLMKIGPTTSQTERTATDSAHIDVICERLRLLYVGITRARRFLQISYSRVKLSSKGSQVDCSSAVVFEELQRYLQER